ncbi:cytochrome P450 [Dacryopinax primogenitus]|uniref:Cytochrome P450 n=1 Tax=Dacryopinax primogenitus (strain DJM 731) TaxID=1858805 RepID=M5G6D4_DACPD|nr:cytochrome P450 [Dacryopinax primogenitus]EJT99327.1 cytochrome P450 [Dacryopinax primogenitus]
MNNNSSTLLLQLKSATATSFSLPLPSSSHILPLPPLLFLALLPCVFIAPVLPRLIRHIFFSPLSLLPGPFLAKHGPLFPVLLLRLRLAQSIAALHRQYGAGSAVVIAPNIVSLSAPEDIRRIYGSHAFRKDARLGKVTFGGVGNVFSELNPVAHTRLLKLTSPSFRPLALLSTQPSLHRPLASLCLRLEKDTLLHGSANIHQLYRLLSFDMLSSALFGHDLGCLEQGGHPVVEDLDAFMLQTALRTVLPAWVCAVLCWLPGVGWTMRADERLAEYGLAALEAHRVLYPAPSSSETGDMLTPLRRSLDSSGQALSDRAIAGNLATYILAGADTTPSALTFITWELARRPDIYAKLREVLERTVREGGMTEGEEWTYERLKECTYLAAVVKEGLRCYPPTVMPMTRVVPPEGFRLSAQPGEKSGQVALEPGTLVCASAWTGHYDPLVFDQPGRFDPGRWLVRDRPADGLGEEEWKESEKKRLERMEECWMPFGVGVRKCQGRLLAEIELYLTIATVVSRFSLSLHPSTTEESMRPVELVTLGPKGGRCEIVFERRGMDLGLQR